MKYLGFLLLITLFGLSACGGGGGGSAPAPEPASRQLVSLSVSTGTATLAVGDSQQYQGIAQYSDGSSANVTAAAAWASDNASILRISNTTGSAGLATGMDDGVATVTATLNGVRGTSRLQVGWPLAQIELIRLQTDRVAVGASTKYVAYGHYTNKIVKLISDRLVWTSSDPSVASIGTAPDPNGTINGVRSGEVLLTAALDGVTATVAFSVLPIKTLAFAVPNLDVEVGDVGIDAMGRSQVMWARNNSGALFGNTSTVNVSSFLPTSGWLPITLINQGVVNDSPGYPVLAVNSQGAAVAAWAAIQGVFAARYVVGSGWQPAKVIFTGTTAGAALGKELRLAIDPSGNAVLIWIDQNNKLVSSQLNAATDTWTVPVDIPNANRYESGSTPAIAINATGRAVVVWERWRTSGTDTGWTVSTSQFVPNVGWTMATDLHHSRIYTRPVVAINDGGEIIVVGVSKTDPGETPVYAYRYSPTEGWRPKDVLWNDGANEPWNVKVAINNAGDGVVVWSDSFTSAIRAHRYSRSGGFETAVLLSPGIFGSPDVLQPFITADGRILATWLTGTTFLGSRRFVPGVGWDPEQRSKRVGHKGQVRTVSMAFNQAGIGIALWSEAYERSTLWYHDVYADTTLSF